MDKELPLADGGAAAYTDNASLGKGVRVSPISRRRFVRRFELALLLISDLAALAAALFVSRISHALYYHEDVWRVFWQWWGVNRTVTYVVFPLVGIITLVALAYEGHYRRRGFWDEMGSTVKVVTIMMVSTAALSFGGKWSISRLWLVSMWILALVFIPLMRLLVRKSMAAAGLWRRPVVVIGNGQNARDTVRALSAEWSLGYDVRAILTMPGTSVSGVLPQHLPISCLSLGIAKSLAPYGDPEVVVALEHDQWAQQTDLISALERDCGTIAVSSPLRDLPLSGLAPLHFFNHEILMLQTRDNLARLGPRIMKRLSDLVMAPLLVFFTSPLLVFIAWRIWREDGGPVFFRHERIGRNGKPFACLKFRSMAIDATDRFARYLADHPELRAEAERNNKLRQDPRVTRIGSFLRRTSLDELPQLFNVIRGEMSLVGPRPIQQWETARYGHGMSLYLRVRPGITGLWQTSGRSETSFEERVAMDVWYVRNWSLWYDVVMLLRTIRVVLKGEGAY